jgi:hypothetical protein
MYKILLTITFFISFYALSAQNRFNELINEGDKLFNSGNYETARNKYNAASTHDPSRSKEADLKIQKINKAIAERDKAKAGQIKVKSEEAARNNARAEAESERVKKEVANKYAKEATRQKQKEERAANNISIAQKLATQDATLALRILHTTLKQNPNNPAVSKAFADIFRNNEFYSAEYGTANGFMTNVALSSDGKFMAASASDKIVRLWKVGNPSSLIELKGHTDTVNCLAFSPNNDCLITGSNDNLIKIWELNGKERKTISGQGAAVKQIGFVKNGQEIVSFSGNRVVKFWNINGVELRQVKGKEIFGELMGKADTFKVTNSTFNGTDTKEKKGSLKELLTTGGTGYHLSTFKGKKIEKTYEYEKDFSKKRNREGDSTRALAFFEDFAFDENADLAVTGSRRT